MRTILPLIAVLIALALVAGNAQDDGRTFFNVNMASINEVGSGYDSDGAGTSVFNSDGTGFLRIELPVGAIANSAYTDDGMFYSLSIAVEGVSVFDTAATSTAITEDQGVLAGTTSTTGITLTLPESAGAAGRTFAVQKADSGTGSLTLSAYTGDLIVGAATFVLGARYDSVTVVSDGTGWMVTSYYDYVAP